MAQTGTVVDIKDIQNEDDPNSTNRVFFIGEDGSSPGIGNADYAATALVDYPEEADPYDAIGGTVVYDETGQYISIPDGDEVQNYPLVSATWQG